MGQLDLCVSSISVIETDLDRIAAAIDKALAAFVGNAHEPGEHRKGSDSITMTKEGFITGVIRFQRLRDWVEGLASTHRAGCNAEDS